MKAIVNTLVVVATLLVGCSDTGSALLDGGRVDLQNSEELLVINYWAAWCAPCIAEMPELFAFAQAYPDRVRVLGVNYDNPTPDQLREDANLLDVQIELLLEDPQTAMGYERPQVLPTTVLVREGEVLETLVGPQTFESLEERLKRWTNS